MASNAIVAANSNAWPLDHYDSVKEFLAIELDAFIIAATLNHFGMEGAESIPTKIVMPENLKNSSKEAERKWLHSKVSTMLEKFVMPGVSRLPNLLAANSHSKYALAALRLKASQLGLLTPGETHRLKWNRFASRKGGEGKCISRDLLVEQVIWCHGNVSVRWVHLTNKSSIESSTKVQGHFYYCCCSLNKILDREHATPTTPTKSSSRHLLLCWNRFTRNQMSSTSRLVGSILAFQRSEMICMLE